MSFYVTLMKINNDHQKLVGVVRVRWNGLLANGILSVTEDFQTGSYLIGAYPSAIMHENRPADFLYLYILNPYENGNQKNEPETEFINNPELDAENNEIRQNKYTFPFAIIEDFQNKDLSILTGKILTENYDPVRAHFSVSITGKQFYDYRQSEFISDFFTGKVNMEKKISAENDKINFDLILKEQSYIQGRLLINDDPAGIKKVYLYAYEKGIPYLDMYITDYEGKFRFPEPPFPDIYTIKLFTIPEDEKNYKFHLLNRFQTDSILYLDIPEYSLPRVREYEIYALKKFLIDQSYGSKPENIDKSSSNQRSMDNLASHVILLDEYIPFHTLAEIIREIVPQVSIKYRKGIYQIRVYDQRAKNYCCKKDPLIFINNEPFPNNTTAINMNASDIYSIAVIRPIEAIREFGDIGINGMLKINLREGITVPVSEGPWKADFKIAGIQAENNFVTSSLPEDYPDFRNFLYWKGVGTTNTDGSIELKFKPSKLNTDFMIIIRGITEKGELLDLDIPFTFE